MKQIQFCGIAASALLSLLIFSGQAWGQAEEAADAGPALTIYSSADPQSFDPQKFIAEQRGGYSPSYVWQVPGYGVVKEIREVKLKKGASELRFDDVAQYIDPTTVGIVDLTDPSGTAVLEQNFQFDLASAEKILDKYLDREIGVFVNRGDTVEEVRGTLLNASGNLVLKTAQGIRIAPASGNYQLGELPGGLITKPALVWKLRSDKEGSHKLRTTYQTDGITWRADYNLVMNGEDTKADLGAWVTVMNLTGTGFNNAKLKLIAGDVQRVQPSAPQALGGMMARSLEMDSAAEGFQEKAFGEYHLYTLPRRTDILNNSTQQLVLFPTAHDVSVQKVLVYYGLSAGDYWSVMADPITDRNFGIGGNGKIDIYIRFKNEKSNNLGMPLPKGKIRVFKEDKDDQTLEFIGEDLIDHTAKDERVLVKIGQAFDVVGERVQTDYSIDTARKKIRESIRVTIRNHKDQPQKVVIKENLYRWLNWKIVEKSDEFEKVDARTINFNIEAPANGEKAVNYTVEYSW